MRVSTVCVIRSASQYCYTCAYIYVRADSTSRQNRSSNAVPVIYICIPMIPPSIPYFRVVGSLPRIILVVGGRN